jgi:hypothetical protein
MLRTLLTLTAFMLPLVFFGQNFKNRGTIGEDSARQAVRSIIGEGVDKLPVDTLIKDKETAIDIAEMFLFKLYGKATITSERPYECYIVDGYWFLRGTLPKNFTGDVFEVIMSAKDGRIFKISHGNR